MSACRRHRLFLPVIFAGGLVFGFGLAVSNLARPEVVLDFLQLEDFGLLFVMGGAAITTGAVFAGAARFGNRAPLTNTVYRRRLKRFDRNVVLGGALFGVGWGLSGICPGAAYASIGLGNWPILWALVGMFTGAYALGRFRSRGASDGPTPTSAD